MAKTVLVSEAILSANDQIAVLNRNKIDQAGVFAINLMASPGAGKTSLISTTVEALKKQFSIAYIDGDIATTIDADKIAALGIPAVQINTGGQCHLDAAMVQSALHELTSTDLDLLIIENVGNLVCPTSFRLGIHKNVLIASIPEGDDKPYKYPAMYQGVDAILLNKMDVISAFDFKMDYFKSGVEILNPGLSFFPVSCKTGEGIDHWVDWVQTEVSAYKKMGGGGYDLR